MIEQGLENINSPSENTSTQCGPSDSKRHSKLLINDLWAQRKIGTRGEYNFTFNLARKRLCRNDMYWTAQRKKDLKTIGFIKFRLALKMKSDINYSSYLVNQSQTSFQYHFKFLALIYLAWNSKKWKWIFEGRTFHPSTLSLSWKQIMQ